MAEPTTENSDPEENPDVVAIGPTPAAAKAELADTDQYDISVQPDAYGDADRVHVTFIFPRVRK